MADLLPTFGVWAACLIAVIVGTAVQRLAGQGFGMVAAPMLGLLAPAYLPGTVLLVGLCVGAGAFMADRSVVVMRDLPPGFAGRALGAVIAAWIAARVVGTPALPLVTGLLVWVAVGLTLLSLRLPLTAPTLFGAGTVSGMMGTLTGIGAPPMAIVYADVETRRSAATQNLFFAFGMAVSITALTVAGVIGTRHLAFALTLAPAVPLTLRAVRPFAARVARGAIRPWALGLATTAAGVLIFRSVI